MPIPSRSTWPRWTRALTSAWVLSPLLVLSLLVGAFFGYGAYTRSQPTHYARGGAFATIDQPAAGSSASARPGAHGARAGKRKGATAGHRRTGAPTTTASSAATSAHRAPTTGGSTSGGHARSHGGAPAGPVYPAAGTYGLAVSGKEHVRFGPFSACTNAFPSHAELAVQPAAGEPAGSYDFDLRLYPDNANRHDERHIYRYGSGGISLSYEQATVTCGGIKQSSTVSYSPVQLRVPASPTVGDSWKDDGGDGARTESGTSKIVGQENVVIAGRSYPTYVIDTHLSMSGSESGSRDQRWWWSPTLGMPLKWTESLSGKRSGATYTEDITCTVVSGP
jgi:hypothetical protein